MIRTLLTLPSPISLSASIRSLAQNDLLTALTGTAVVRYGMVAVGTQLFAFATCLFAANAGAQNELESSNQTSSLKTSVENAVSINNGVTLEQVIADAIANDNQYRAAQAELRAGKMNTRLSRAGLLPQIDASGSWTKADTENNIPNEGGVDNPNLQDGETTTLSYSANISQPLFNLAAYRGYELGKKTSDLAQATFLDAQQDILLRAAEAYFAVLEARDNLETALAEKKALAQQLEQTKQRFQVGLIAITGVHESQAAFDAATATALIAEGNVGVAKASLEVLTGQFYNKLASLAESFPVRAPEPANVNDWRERALEGNINIVQASLRREQADLIAQQEKATLLPSVTGTAGYTDTENEFENSSFTFKQDEFRYGVRVDVPLFAGGRRYARSKQAAFEAEAARENYLLTRAQVQQNVTATHLNVSTGAASIRARQQAIVSAQSAYEATQAGYEVGTRDLVDVLNAQQQVFRAQRDYYDTLYSYILNSLQLQRLVGDLTREDLKALNNFLVSQ